MFLCTYVYIPTRVYAYTCSIRRDRTRSKGVVMAAALAPASAPVFFFLRIAVRIVGVHVKTYFVRYACMYLFVLSRCFSSTSVYL